MEMLRFERNERRISLNGFLALIAGTAARHGGDSLRAIFAVRQVVFVEERARKGFVARSAGEAIDMERFVHSGDFTFCWLNDETALRARGRGHARRVKHRAISDQV